MLGGFFAAMKGEKNEPTKAFSASNVGNLDNASVGRMRCSCCYTHTLPTNGYTHTHFKTFAWIRD